MKLFCQVEVHWVISSILLHSIPRIYLYRQCGQKSVLHNIYVWFRYFHFRVVGYAKCVIQFKMTFTSFHPQSTCSCAASSTERRKFRGGFQSVSIHSNNPRFLTVSYTWSASCFCSQTSHRFCENGLNESLILWEWSKWVIDSVKMVWWVINSVKMVNMGHLKTWKCF